MSLLETYKSDAAAQVEKDVKNRSQAILRDYRNSWDEYAEMLQNSVDSINRRFKIMQSGAYEGERFDIDADMISEDEYKGKILIEITPSSRIVQISDNGTGMKPDKIEKLLLPDGSDKKQGKEYGYKGKGLTYVVFSSKSFNIKSRYFGNKSKTYEFGLDGLFDWVRDDTATVAFPVNPIPDVVETTENLGEYNTRIRVQLCENYKELFSPLACLDNSFDLLECLEYEAFENLLRTKTAIGNTHVLFNKNPLVDIEIKMVVYNDDGTTAYKNNVPYKYAHPKDLVSTLSYDFTDYVRTIIPRAGSDKKFYCLTHTETELSLGERPPITVNVCLSAILKESLNDINQELGYSEEMIALGAGYEPGVYLALDGMPTGICLAKWAEKKGGTYLRYYVIVDCSLAISNELDSGRKGITSYRAELISELAFNLRNTCIDNSNKFHSYATSDLTCENDDKDTRGLFGEEPDDFKSRVMNAKQKVNDESTDKIAKFVTENSSLIHTPTNEEEVRTLFHELLAKGIIKGYKTVFDAANRSTYDAAFDYNLDVIDSNARPNDKNGLTKQIVSLCKKKGITTIDSSIWSNRCKHKSEKVLCVEFKDSLNALMSDILDMKSSKSPEDIDLVITWDYEISKEYSQKCTYTKDDNPNTVFLHSVTNELKITNPRGTSLFCICLKKVIENILC